MSDTTQEELPPLPKNDRSVRGWDWPYSPQEMKAYARQCIATLKAENAEWKRIADQAHAALAENKGGRALERTRLCRPIPSRSTTVEARPAVERTKEESK